MLSIEHAEQSCWAPHRFTSDGIMPDACIAIAPSIEDRRFRSGHTDIQAYGDGCMQFYRTTGCGAATGRSKPYNCLKLPKRKEGKSSFAREVMRGYGRHIPGPIPRRRQLGLDDSSSPAKRRPHHPPGLLPIDHQRELGKRTLGPA